MKRVRVCQVMPEETEAWLDRFDSLPSNRPSRFESAFIPLYLVITVVLASMAASCLVREAAKLFAYLVLS